MADLLQTGSAWLSGVMKAHVSKSITYRRGTASVTITDATIGQTTDEVLDQSQQLVHYESRDFIFDVSELVLNGVTVLPQTGDLIEEVVGSETWTYELMPNFPRTPPWTYADPYHQRLRVRTKLSSKT